MKCVWRPFVVIAVIAAVALVVPLTATAGATVKTSGFVLVNAAFNTGNPANPDIPTAARADGDAAESFLITPRQSRLTLTMADEESYWTPTGKMEMDFWDCTPPAARAG